MKKGKVLKIVIPVFVIGVVGFGVYYFGFGKSDTASTNKTKTEKVSKGEIKPTLAVTGTVASENETGVNFETSGELIEVNVKVGDVVTAGQQLAKIDDTELQRQVTIQKATYNSAVAKYNQTKADDKADSYDIQMQSAAVTQAKQNYQEALDNLDTATLTSPAAGTVLEVDASVGEQVGGTGSTGSTSQGSSSTGTDASSSSSAASSSDFVVIADLTKLQIEASIDQVDIPKIAKDQVVTITFDALSDREFKGKVTNIDPTATTSSDVVTYNITTSIENPDSKIQLGMTADLEIDLGRKENVLIVPNMAIKTKDDSKVVTKMINGTATEVAVEVGLSDDEHTEITSGLSEGDEIVVDMFSTTSGTGGTGNTGQSSGGDGGPGMMPGL